MCGILEILGVVAICAVVGFLTLYLCDVLRGRDW